jgi:hypothetical protein
MTNPNLTENEFTADLGLDQIARDIININDEMEGVKGANLFLRGISR